MDFDTVNRDYAHARQHFSLSIPEHYNFAYDVIDRLAVESDGTAIIAVDRSGETIRHVSYSELSAESNRFANALFALGLNPGDHAWLSFEGMWAAVDAQPVSLQSS